MSHCYKCEREGKEVLERQYVIVIPTDKGEEEQSYVVWLCRECRKKLI